MDRRHSATYPQHEGLYHRQQMLTHEMALYERGYHSIGGVDEAGRGPLAGPVVAAAVILRRDVSIPGIDDSKKLSESRREFLYEEIQQKTAGCGVGIVPEETIDRINILRASLKAMKLAVLSLPVEPDFVLVDGPYLPTLDLPMKALPHGDSLSLSIAAASIVAKVTRDRIMRKLDRMYPQYGFARNKGYPTAEHRAALDRFGPCEVHRRSFAPVSERLRQPDIPLVNTSFSVKAPTRRSSSPRVRGGKRRIETKRCARECRSLGFDTLRYSTGVR
jgi:ribonuclease HII